MIRKITRFTKIAIISITLIILTLAVVIGLVYYLYPEESVKQIVKEKAEVLLNRKIEIESLHYSPMGIVIEKVTIYDSNNSVLVKADEAVITFSILSVLKKEFELNSLSFNGLEVNWVFLNDGSSNIKNLLDEMKEKSSGGDRHIQLSKIILNNCRLRLVTPPEIIKPLEGEYNVTGTVFIDSEKNLHLKDSKIILPHKRGTLYPELDIVAKGNFSIKGRTRLENANIPWTYRFSKNPINLPYETVNGQVDDLEITREFVKGHANATSTLRGTKSIISGDGSCIVEIPTRNILLKDIKGKINSSYATVENLLILGRGGGLKKFSFSNVSFQIEDLRHILNFIPPHLTGLAKGGLSYDGINFNGRLALSDIAYNNRFEQFSGLTTTIDIVNNTIRKENIPVVILGSPSKVSIATTDSRFKNFYLSITSDKININNIRFRQSEGSPSADQPQQQSERKFSIPVNISGKFTANELVYRDFIFRGIDSNLSVSGGTVKVNNIRTSVLSGSVTGFGSIDISGGTPAIHSVLKFSNVKIHDIKFENENLNRRFFGFADGTANLSLLIRENAAETIKGNAIFTITKGKVVNTGVQNGLIVFLSELRYKLKDLEFNRIYGNFEIQGPDIKINSFIFNSEDVRLSMDGKINRDLNAEDMHMKLEFNNHFVKDIPRPALAVFNKYSTGKWFVIPFLLNGNITESKNLKILK